MSILAKSDAAAVVRGTIGALALLAAPALAAAQDPPRSADEEILQIYESVCVRGEEAPAGFQPVEWSEFPEALRLMNTYGHEGTFLRREGDGRLVYIARTSGAGHDSVVASERRCGVAIRGASFDRLARAFGRQLRTRPMRMNMIGHQVIMFPASPLGLLSVNEADEGWIIVRAYDISMRAN
ncbi:MAG TPA: hypothetical protein VGW40_08555 [Allosphingosinicella sp.]|nr:hypothetical protein [Allosphingosinicella sp.]